MSESIAKKCLTHYNERHIQVRKDFLDICTYDKSLYNTETRKSGKTKRDEPNRECMAMILRLLETLTDHRKTALALKNETRIAKKLQPLREPDEYRIELAYSTIARLLLDTYGESTVRNSIAALLQMNYIKRYQKSRNSIPEYVLNIDVIQPLLQQNANEPDAETEDIEVLHSTPEQDEMLNSTSEVSHSTSQGVHVTPEPLHSTPNYIGSEIPSKTEDKKESMSPAASDSFSIEDQKQRCWSLWLNVDQNQEVPPDLTPIAEKYLTFFAPRLLTQEQMDSLVESTRKALSKQHKRKIWKVALGNMHTHYPEWKHEQESQSQDNGSETSQDQPQDDWLTSMKARSGVRSGMMEKTARAKMGA